MICFHLSSKKDFEWHNSFSFFIIMSFLMTLNKFFILRKLGLPSYWILCRIFFRNHQMSIRTLAPRNADPDVFSSLHIVWKISCKVQLYTHMVSRLYEFSNDRKSYDIFENIDLVHFSSKDMMDDHILEFSFFYEFLGW